MQCKETCYSLKFRNILVFLVLTEDKLNLKNDFYGRKTNLITIYSKTELIWPLGSQ